MTDIVIETGVIFKIFDKLQDIIGCPISEVSVKQHQIAIGLNSSVLEFDGILSLIETIPRLSNMYVATNQDELYIIIEDIVHNDFLKELHQVITFLADNICKCPSLEYVFSEQYIKFYLDKPGLTLKDLHKVENLFNSRCTLELGIQRPYILFINEESE